MINFNRNAFFIGIIALIGTISIIKIYQNSKKIEILEKKNKHMESDIKNYKDKEKQIQEEKEEEEEYEKISNNNSKISNIELISELNNLKIEESNKNFPFKNTMFNIFKKKQKIVEVEIEQAITDKVVPIDDTLEEIAPATKNEIVPTTKNEATPSTKNETTPSTLSDDDPTATDNLTTKSHKYSTIVDKL